MTPDRSRRRTALLLALTALISISLAVVASEVVLRVVYRDGGRTTLGGPGGREFVYTYLPGTELRGPMDTGPKSAGVNRIMVLGDSITWGQGVTEWTDTYPARLLQTLNAGGQRFDMAVYAYPGKEIDNHLSTIAKVVGEVHPDIVVYQWYSNDVEISKAARPVSRRRWRAWPGHATLRAWSHLYYALDFALDLYLPATGRSYLQYLQEDYADGTPAWRAFTRTFHSWAAYATGHARRTILMLYPVVPPTALVELRQRMTTLAAGQVLTFAPSEMTHTVGDVSADASALTARPGSPAGELAVTPGVRLAHGDYVASVQLRLEAPASAAVARLTVTYGASAAPLARVEIHPADLSPSGAWQTVRLPFHIEAPLATDVAVHVEFVGNGGLSVGRMDLPVHYGIEVLDLAPHLAGLNTASSLFDAHPNARAHAMMAEVLATTIQSRPLAAGTAPTR